MEYVNILTSTLNNPYLFAFNSNNELYCTRNTTNDVVKINNDGSVVVLANFADGIFRPMSLAFNANDELYCSSSDNGTIRKINANGTTEIFASGIDRPYDLIFDNNGILYCVANGNNKIVKIDPSGVVTDFVSNNPLINRPYGITFDNSGNLYCTNLNNNSIVKITAQGDVSLFVSNINVPTGITFFNNYLYVCGFNSGVVDVIDLNGVVYRHLNNDYNFVKLVGLKFDKFGTLYISDNITSNMFKVNSNTETFITLNNSFDKNFGELSFNLNPISNNPTSFIYGSSNASVASVDLSGNVYINSPGVATITISKPAGFGYLEKTITTNINADSVYNVPIYIYNNEQLHYFFNSSAIYAKFKNKFIVNQMLRKSNVKKILKNGFNQSIYI